MEQRLSRITYDIVTPASLDQRAWICIVQYFTLSLQIVVG